MNKDDFMKLPIEKRRLIAVSHLVREKSERPEDTAKLFQKLETTERAAAQTNSAIQQAEASLNELSSNFMRTIGSLQTITELIAEMLPEEKIDEWCAKYVPPKNVPNMPTMPSMPGGGKIIQPGPSDMAGITSKQNQ